jgi:hypothetical protein
LGQQRRTSQGRAAIRQASAEDAQRSRAAQGIAERVEDWAVIAVLAAILRDAPAPITRKKQS